MAIDFACGHCGKDYRVDDALAGEPTKCRDCGQPMMIPLADGTIPLTPTSAAGGQVDWNGLVKHETGAATQLRRGPRSLLYRILHPYAEE